MRSFLLAATAAAVAATAIACSIHVGGETNGAHGNADFSYSNCFLGCTTTTPMMLGDEEDVSVNGSIPDTVSVDTSAPSIVSVKSASRACCTQDADAGTTCRTTGLNTPCAAGETASLSVTVDALAVGSSDLVVKNADGSVWDSVTLSVEQATSLQLACNNTKGSVTLVQNATCPVTWQATDANGKAMMSTAGIHLTTSNPGVASFNGFLTANQSDIQAIPQLFGSVSIAAVGPGDAVVTAVGGGATETLAVHVNP
jgi:hypothetical protein